MISNGSRVSVIDWASINSDLRVKVIVGIG